MIKRRCSAVKRKKKRPLRQSANAPPFLQLVAAGEKRTNPTLGFSPSEGGALPPPGGGGGKRGQDTKVSYPLLRLPNFPLAAQRSIRG